MQRKNNIVLRLHRQRRPEQVLLPLVREENGEALRIILEKQDNVTAEFTQRTEKRVRSGWLKLEIEQDGCRRSDNLEEELPVILEVETDIRPEAMTAMYLLNDWWTRPAFIEDFFGNSGADAGDLRKAEKRILFPASNAGKTV